MKILMLSGGADSMLLYQRYKFDKCIFFDYGQPHLQQEYQHCKQYIDEYIELPDFAKRQKEYNARNLSFITLLVSIYGNDDLQIYIGTNANDIYPDNNRGFFNDLEQFLQKLTFKSVEIVTPLIDMDKEDILHELNLSYFKD